MKNVFYAYGVCKSDRKKNRYLYFKKYQELNNDKYHSIPTKK